MKIMIATPSTGGMVTNSYATSLMNAAKALRDAGADFDHQFAAGADIAANRNYLANRFLRDGSLSHILFIDSDMLIRRAVFALFLAAGKDVVGAIYAHRRLDEEKLAEKLRQGLPIEQARALSAEYNVALDPGDHVVENMLVPVRAFGFGCVLIARRALESMIERGTSNRLASLIVRRAGLTRDAYDFFREIDLPDGDRLSKDYSFCQRARATGEIELYGYVGGGVLHTGGSTSAPPISIA